MKKIALLLVFAMLMTVVLGACNPDTGEEGSSDEEINSIVGDDTSTGEEEDESNVEPVSGDDSSEDVSGDGSEEDNSGESVTSNTSSSVVQGSGASGASSGTTSRTTSSARSARSTRVIPKDAKVITVWGDNNDQTLLSAAADFEKKNPKVVVNVEAPGDITHSAFERAIMGGTAPDAIKQDHVYITGLGEKGYLADLAKYGANKVRSKFVKSCWNGVTFGNKVYGLPHDGNTIALAYNRTLIQKWTGKKTIPNSYNAIIKLAKDAAGKKKHNEYVFTVPFFEAGRYEIRKNWAAFNFFFWLWGNGGEILDKNNKKATFNSAAGINALNQIQRLFDEDIVDQTYYEPEFYDGTVGLIEMGNWAMPRFENTSKRQEFGVNMMPTLAYYANGKPRPAYSGLGLFAFGVSEKSKYKKEAYEFIRDRCTDTSLQRKFADQHNQLPVTEDALKDSKYRTKPMWATFVKQFRLTKARPGVRNWAQIENIVADHVMAAIRDNKKAQEELRIAADKVNAQL
ncbi:MAG: extracellular solute-binding protein [Oscillospiraceae bacterium]|nr:extracellular solute-binding protein [Oscillospiraceae bacterium]